MRTIENTTRYLRDAGNQPRAIGNRCHAVLDNLHRCRSKTLAAGGALCFAHEMQRRREGAPLPQPPATPVSDREGAK